MVTYVQIGKGPRMAINDTLKNIRMDFIKQLPGFKRLVPIYFYSSKTAENYTGVLIPYRYKGSKAVDYIWVTQEYYWDVYVWDKEISMSRDDYGTGSYYAAEKVVKAYKNKGYKF